MGEKEKDDGPQKKLHLARLKEVIGKGGIVNRNVCFQEKKKRSPFERRSEMVKDLCLQERFGKGCTRGEGRNQRDSEQEKFAKKKKGGRKRIGKKRTRGKPNMRVETAKSVQKNIRNWYHCNLKLP